MNLYRGACFERGLSTGSVTRMFGTQLRAVVNLTARELGLADVKPFSGVYFGYPKEASVVAVGLCEAAGASET